MPCLCVEDGCGSETQSEVEDSRKSVTEQTDNSADGQTPPQQPSIFTLSKKEVLDPCWYCMMSLIREDLNLTQPLTQLGGEASSPPPGGKSPNYQTDPRPHFGIPNSSRSTPFPLWGSRGPRELRKGDEEEEEEEVCMSTERDLARMSLHTPSESVSSEEEQNGTLEESTESPDSSSGRHEQAADVSEWDESPASGWDLLPDVCLQHVLVWLGDRDRARASLVCRRWHRATRSPALWRSRHFHLTGRCSPGRCSEHDLAVGYARSLGAFLEELEVLVALPYRCRVTVARRLQLALRALFQGLCGSGARLRSLSVRNLQLQRDAWSRSTRNAIVHNLAHFLGHMATHLLHLSLGGSRMTLAQGLKVLKALARTQQHLNSSGGKGGGILSLDLEGFFAPSEPVHTHPPFSQLLGHFHRLEWLSLSYSCVSDELLEALGSSQQVKGRGCGSLKCLRLKCHNEEPHSQVVWEQAWASLVQRCPKLCVEFDVEGITNVDRLQRILLPRVPLVSFTMSECNFSEQDVNPKPIFRDILPHFWCQLQVLSVEIDNCYQSVDEELLELVMMCSQLDSLMLNAYLELSFVEQLLEYCQHTSCPIRSLDVKVCYLSEGESHEEVEEEKLRELLSYHSHFVHPALQLSVELYPIK
ncbi:hypothetical protein ACEWY4_009108 [Coilia grayii]|uniref:F-box domain-containing protein n=1 Tax=Coilia grayii TaxID=363190 RepID=A0ABD1K5I5_9TELE